MNKKSDTLIIYGGGSSLNNFDSEKFVDFDKITINNVIKAKKPLTHYILGEGLAYSLFKATTEENTEYREIFKKEYDDSIKILKEDYKSIIIIFIKKYQNTMTFLNKYLDIIALEFKDRKNIEYYNNCYSGNNIDYTNKNIYHGESSICCCINYAIQNKYKNILFVGIDLYNSKYAYNFLFNKINKNENTVHSTKHSIFSLINNSKHLINFFVYDNKSLLNQIIPQWNNYI